MLKIPANWNEVSETATEPKRMPAGGYVCRIVKAFESVNKYDEPCLTLYLDVDEGEFKNYFGEIYRRRVERGKDRYPCVYSQRTDEFATRNFKRLIKLLERCNGDFSCDVDGGDVWDEREIENLKLGVVFREKILRRGDSRWAILLPHTLKTIEQIRNGEFTVPEETTGAVDDNG